MLAPVSPRPPVPPSRALALAGLLGLVLGLACHVSNDDHCVHKAIDSDAWCAENVAGRGYCSPCVAEQHGCVAERPDAAECPDYTPDSSGGASETSGG